MDRPKPGDPMQGHVLAVQADVADPAAVKNLFDRAAAEFGGVDVLVSNAGIMPLAKFTDAESSSRANRFIYCGSRSS